MRFSQSILSAKKAGQIPVIPDFKRISPKEGELFQGRSPAEAARLFEQLGAPCLSVVTEREQFGGSMELLRELVSAVKLPVLRKDFIHSEDDIKETADSGAAAVLLICACMTEKELHRCYEAALLSGIEPLVEAHTSGELALALRLGAKLVGINNRDIGRLEKDNGGVERTVELIAQVPADRLVISESGITSPPEARAAIAAGAGAVLVGTALWRAQDMIECYRQFCAGTV